MGSREEIKILEMGGQKPGRDVFFAGCAMGPSLFEKWREVRFEI